MVNKYILDTNILIGTYRSRKKTIAVLNKIDSELFAISVFNYTEFLAGATLQRKNDAAKFLRTYDVIDFDDKCKKILTQLSREYVLPSQKLSDFLIASVCLANKCGIVTTNAKDFIKFKGLKVISVPQSAF
jgi:predicted nucleic acid-binding protein